MSRHDRPLPPLAAPPAPVRRRRTTPPDRVPRPLLPARARSLTALLLLGALGACGGGRTPAVVANAPGSTFPDPEGSGRLLFADPHQGGAATEPRLASVRWGRLVQVFGLDAAGVRTPMHPDVVIGADVIHDGASYLLETNPVTGEDQLTILRDVTDTAPGGGLDAFMDLLHQAEQGLVPVHQGGGAAGVPSLVPRNAALVLRFDDLLDPATVDDRTVRTLVGVPSVVPFEARVLCDPNHGDVVVVGGQAVFRPTRVVVDTTLSELDLLRSDQPLALNRVGLPPSTNTNQPNLLLRLPTVPSALQGQAEVLRNLTGHALSPGADPVDLGSLTNDLLVRARSGGFGEVTGDLHNGFLRDDVPPRVVGSMGCAIPPGFAPVPLNDAGRFVLPRLEFDQLDCAPAPAAGDVLVQEGVLAEVLGFTPLSAPGVASEVTVQLLSWPEAWDAQAGPSTWAEVGVGEARLRVPFDPDDDAGRAVCFVEVFPAPPGDAGVGQDLALGSTFGLRFSEPMDAASLTAFDSLTLTREPPPGADEPPLGSADYVVGTVVRSLDRTGFTLVPQLPLAHEFGVAETYHLALQDDPVPPRDLAGNGLDATPAPVALSVRADQGTVRNGGRVSRFERPDAEPPVGGDGEPLKPEFGGQLLWNAALQRVEPRPVTRFRALADRSSPMVGLMIPVSPGLQTPLSSLGSRMQTVWRYADLSMGLTDPSTHNLDVEHLWWVPFGGLPVFDTFPALELSLAHCRFAPDERKGAQVLPQFPQSGLRHAFDANVLAPGNHPPKVVHPRQLGMTVNPGEVVQLPGGTNLAPWPLNRDVAPAERQYFTWRDTSILARGGNNSGGVPPQQEFLAFGLPPTPLPYYPAGQVPSVGLPLLMDFRCYPSDAAAGVNPFDVSIAINSSSQPYFRTWVTGGTNQQGVTVSIDPDLQTQGNGGFNPTSLPVAGAELYGRDPTFYLGAADFVVRVSRGTSVWFPADDPASPGVPFAAPHYAPPVVEPAPEEQPLGTSLRIDVRGASSIEVDPSFAFPAPGNLGCPADLPAPPTVHPALESALALDPYGDHYWDEPAVLCEDVFPTHPASAANRGIAFWDGPAWREDVASLSGARYYQLRLTFVSNATTGQVPVLSALAMAWED